MPNNDVMAELFEAHRPRLAAVAYRMLGSLTEADDAVQEAWIRLSRSDADAIENLGGWLTTVVARVCLNMLRARRTRGEEPIAEVADHDDADPEEHAVIADSVGLALLVVLDTLEPAERLAFVLHDMFGVPFDEIATIVERSPAAARQMASRARRRVQGAPAPAADRSRQRAVVEAFVTASRDGDFEALVRLLHPEAVVRADGAAVAMGATAEVRGATDVATTFAGRARATQLALIDGAVGLVWARGGQPQMVFVIRTSGNHVTAIEMIADRSALDRMKLSFL